MLSVIINFFKYVFGFDKPKKKRYTMREHERIGKTLEYEYEEDETPNPLRN